MRTTKMRANSWRKRSLERAMASKATIHVISFGVTTLKNAVTNCITQHTIQRHLVGSGIDQSCKGWCSTTASVVPEPAAC